MRAMKRIMGKGAYKSGRVRQAAHDGNREFITLLAYISAIGKKIPASLLYTSESASSNGWTCDAYGLKWLIDVFEPVTRPTSPYTKRLLIVDGYLSHPLNVVLFGLLLLVYYKELNAFNVRGLSIVPMKKKNFLKLFRPAWRISFTKENILKAFAKPSIWLYDPVLVLNALKDEKKSRARGKRLNVLGEEHIGPILFLAENVRRAQERFTKKEVFEKLERIRIDTKKAEIAAKKQKAKVKNAEKALQAAVREDNIEQAPMKARKALVIKKKVVRFISGDIEGSRGRAIKPRVIFESGSN
ncbi:hypothetical protein L207DRAFT_519662 [Hyaloscypha variabilis F]|uniref:DDE-1 domain-containing protein n=1 Tax=Hyaloscypha variabilis (strain UAMH 11265 / GT02V1 / F) TaxID=1149755 RepID=A0A2J6QXI6_HYAVF|nr:hypothetical protein L207DRAFT_519662 [Hyaloscypha variabilis F]